MPTETELVAQAAQLRDKVKQHKKAIYQHREALQAAAAKLADLERECRARGIRLVLVPAPRPGVEVTHGPDRTHS
jgi:TRAP-type uncharacterized transport system substrate-binding protein